MTNWLTSNNLFFLISIYYNAYKNFITLNFNYGSSLEHTLDLYNTLSQNFSITLINIFY